MAKKRTTLTQKQRQAIQLALEGRKWTDIRETLELGESTLWEWRQNPLFQTELNISQEALLNETSLLFNTYVSAGYATLYKIAVNKENKYDAKLQAECARDLVSLPLLAMEKLRVIEHNRRELRMEDADQENVDNQITE
jgi:hypothetical protein